MNPAPAESRTSKALKPEGHPADNRFQGDPMKAARKIASVIESWKADPKLARLEEPLLRQAVGLRMLSLLGWDIFNVEEVQPDFRTGASTVAFALCLDGLPRILFEVRREEQDLETLHGALLEGARKTGAELVVHTDGRLWWAFLPGAGETVPEALLGRRDLTRDPAEQLAKELSALFSREQVATGSFLAVAGQRHRERRRARVLEALPQAWGQLLAEPDPRLVALLSAATASRCGQAPEASWVVDFLRHRAAPEAPPGPESIFQRNFDGEEGDDRGGEETDTPADAGIRRRKPEFFSGQTVRAFSFRGKTVAVNSWEELLVRLCHEFAAAHPQDFEKVLWMNDGGPLRFSRYSEQLKMPEKIRKTAIYVETRLSPEEIVRTAIDLLKSFGYALDDLILTTGAAEAEPRPARN